MAMNDGRIFTGSNFLEMAILALGCFVRSLLTPLGTVPLAF